MNQRIYYFEVVRDIPYSLWNNKPDYNCVVKNDILMNLFENMGLECRRRVCIFHWEDLPIPDYVLKHPHSDPSYHEFLEVNIDDSFIRVDPSWDALLAPKFPVNRWDGESNMDIAVDPIEILPVEDSQRVRDKISENEYTDTNDKFYFELNRYLNKVRRA